MSEERIRETLIRMAAMAINPPILIREKTDADWCEERLQLRERVAALEAALDERDVTIDALECLLAYERSYNSRKM